MLELLDELAGRGQQVDLIGLRALRRMDRTHHQLLVRVGRAGSDPRVPQAPLTEGPSDHRSTVTENQAARRRDALGLPYPDLGSVARRRHLPVAPADVGEHPLRQLGGRIAHPPRLVEFLRVVSDPPRRRNHPDPLRLREDRLPRIAVTGHRLLDQGADGRQLQGTHVLRLVHHRPPVLAPYLLARSEPPSNRDDVFELPLAGGTQVDRRLAHPVPGV